MEKKYSELNIRQKMEMLITEMVEKEIDLGDALGEFEKCFYEIALAKYEGNKSRMAKALGVHRNTLHNRMKTLKVKPKR